MIHPLPSSRVSYEEFVRLAESDERRLEYFDGIVLAQADPSRPHENIVSNISLTLGPAVRIAGCRFYTRGAVWSPHRNNELSPDWLVICDPRDLAGDGPERSRSRYRYPRMLIEVLSPSNTAAEMAAKFASYNGIGSIECYLIIDSMRQQVWNFVRRGGTLVESPAGVSVDTPFGVLSLADIYHESGVPSFE